MKALIIDDSLAMRSILKKIVSPLGYEIVQAANGQEGLQQLASHQIELILVDWNMPVMNGLEFAKSVRADERHKATKLVMVTTETEPEQMVRALKVGVDEFVMKPFTTEILVEKLRYIGVNIPSESPTSC
ncbi:MAG: chemotaxis response regulator CheY [Fuerstiella sp.]